MTDLIHGYVMAFPDETDLLAGALNSLARFCDKIYLVDGGWGQGTLCHNKRWEYPLTDWLRSRSQLGPSPSGLCTWKGIALRVMAHDFKDPGSQRNWTLAQMAVDDGPRPKWIAWLDADDVATDQFCDGIRDLVKSLPSDITNIIPKYLNLVQDERHCVINHSDWLAHGRLHRPGSAFWSGNWHEHQVYQGQRIQYGTWICHLRPLYRRRLWLQRGHPTIARRSTIRPECSPFWDDAQIGDAPEGVTWPTLEWPAGEVEIPFDADILEWEGGKYAE